VRRPEGYAALRALAIRRQTLSDDERLPGNEDEAAGLLDSYLERANTHARLAAVESR
jgi:hypothetical protein